MKPPVKKRSPSDSPQSLRPQRTLGPLPDLERHLPAEWWRTLFNALYLKTDGDVVDNAINTKNDIDLLISATGIKPEDAILDLCCGQGRHSLELARRGYASVHGVDRSRYLVRLARKRAKNENLKVQFSEGDARRFRLREASRDCVIVMGNSFGYFESEQDDIAVLKSIRRVLKPRGILVLDLMDGQWMAQNFEPRSWEWIDQNHFVNRERSLSSDGKRIISREVITHAEMGVIADQFYAERLYTFEEISRILAGLGFTNIIKASTVNTASTREQDLGMMAQRVFITARAPEKKPSAAKPAEKRKIAVLMGDPRLPDPVKKGGKFNEEDLDTIRRLHSALAKLDSYQFDYWDDHTTLIQRLLSEKPGFVLNLCDEGYYNNARKELHVPALLEMLDIPYTGAGPGCLSLCYDKAHVRAIAQNLDIPVPLESYFSPSDQSAHIPATFPALLKPACGDSSIGITQKAVVHSASELVEYLNFLKETLRGTPVLIQEYLTGTEYSVGLIGNPGNFETLPVLEVDYSALPPDLPKILSYESKWHPDSPYWTSIKYKEAAIDDDTRSKLVGYSRTLFERLECRDYARFDFRCDANGVAKLMEVNPNPGWCWDGKFNLMAGFAGIDYVKFLGMIVKAAVDRIYP